MLPTSSLIVSPTSYLLVAIVRQRLNLKVNLSALLEIVSVSLFEKTPIQQAFSLDGVRQKQSESHNQLRLLDC